MPYPTKKLGGILEKTPRLHGVLTKNYKSSGKFPIVDQGLLLVAGYTDGKSSVYQGDLPVIIFGDHTRALKFIDFPFAVGADGTKILRPSSEFDPKYFYYFLQSVEIPSRGYARHFSLLKEIEIPGPSVGEQRKIVAKIEKQFAKIDEVVRLRAESLILADQLLPAAFYEIFQLAEERGWRESEIMQVCKLKTGATPSRAKTEYFDGNIKWLVSGDIHQMEIFDCEGRISSAGMENSNAKILPKNSVLIALNGQGKTKGTVAILRTEAACNQSLVAMIPNEDLMPEFLFFVLKARYLEIRGLAGNDSRKGLNMKIIGSIKIPLPPVAEQKKIVKKLNVLAEKTRALHKLQTVQAADLKALKQSVLHEAFSGKV